MAKINPTQAAKRLKVSRMRVNQWIHKGVLPATRWGHYWQIDEKDIEKLKAKRKKDA